MRLLDILNPYRWLILLALLGGLAGAHIWRVHAAEKRGHAAGDTAGAARVQAQYDAFKGEMVTRTTRLLTDAYRVGGLMKTSFDQRSQELDHEITRISHQRDALAERLRQRPDRPADGARGAGHLPSDSTSADAAAGCTGAQLYRSDATFLAGEAARADTIRAALSACHAHLDEARQRSADFSARHAAPLPPEPVHAQTP